MSDILVHTRGPVRHLVLNRPERRNALTHAMYSALAEALHAADADSDVRVIRISGSAGHFSSGNDLGDFQQSPPRDLDAPVFRFLEALRTARKPIVADVRGVAVGIGTTLLLHCDLVYCDATARFQMPFTSLGLCPEGGSSLLLPYLAGLREASRLFMLGDVFDAETAQRHGIVNAVLPPDRLDADVEAVVQRLCAQPAAAIRLAKSLLRRADDGRLAEHMREEALQFMQRLDSAETAEAIAAFREKRAPDFSRFS